MTDVTDADREKARQLLRSIAVGTGSTTVEIVAAALAEERAKARAPFLALAREMSRRGDMWTAVEVRRALEDIE